MVKLNKQQIAILAALGVLILIFGGFIQTIVPTQAYPEYNQGQSITWTNYISEADGKILFTKLGCANNVDYTSIQLTYETRLECNTGTRYGAAKNNAINYASCNYFSGSSSPIKLGGQSSVNVPQDATSCKIVATYYAKLGNTEVSTPESNPITLIIKPQTICTEGQYRCQYNSLDKCVGNIWIQQKMCNCATTGIGGYCQQICSPNSIKCYADTIYQVCDSSGNNYGGFIYLSGSNYCKNNALVKLCSDGSYILTTQTCPTTTTPQTKTCPDGSIILTTETCPVAPTKECWDGSRIPTSDTCSTGCGDNICQATESPEICLRDCPIVCTTQKPECPSGYYPEYDSKGCPTGQCEGEEPTPPVIPETTKFCADGSVVSKDTMCPEEINNLLLLAGGIALASVAVYWVNTKGKKRR